VSDGTFVGNRDALIGDEPCLGDKDLKRAGSAASTYKKIVLTIVPPA
jgi:hypothetical protein